jgi:hypothetical protein
MRLTNAAFKNLYKARTPGAAALAAWLCLMAAAGG